MYIVYLEGYLFFSFFFFSLLQSCNCLIKYFMQNKTCWTIFFFSFLLIFSFNIPYKLFPKLLVLCVTTQFIFLMCSFFLYFTKMLFIKFTISWINYNKVLFIYVKWNEHFNLFFFFLLDKYERLINEVNIYIYIILLIIIFRIPLCMYIMILFFFSFHFFVLIYGSSNFIYYLTIIISYVFILK